MNIWEIDVGVLIIARDCAAKEAGPSCPKLGNGSKEYLKGHLWGRDAREQMYKWGSVTAHTWLLTGI